MFAKLKVYPNYVSCICLPGVAYWYYKDTQAHFQNICRELKVLEGAIKQQSAQKFKVDMANMQKAFTTLSQRV